jgi:hypothetical protein
MSWIKDEINLRKRREDLCKHAEEFREAVWHEMEERAIEANREGIRAMSDGDNIIIPRAKGGAPKTVTVRVGRDGCSVEASNGGKRFPLGFHGDSPSLMEPNSSSAISIEEAARQILKPFLFDD